jgi:two-component system, LuxR family, sensor kinase FixL
LTAPRRPGSGWPGFDDRLDDAGSRDELVERVADREEMLLQALRIAGVGGWELDLDSGTLSWSEETYRIFGVDPDREKPSNELFYSLVHPDDRARMLGNQSRSFETGDIFDEEYRIIRQDGALRYLNSRAQVVPRGPRRVNRFLGVVRDITERLLFEQAIEAERAKTARLQADLIHISRLSAMETMAAALAHELNQPLAAIANFAAAARSTWGRDRLAAELPEVAAGIEANAQRAGEIIRRLRAMTRRESGHRGAVPLAEAVREAAELALIGTDRRIDYDLAPDLAVDADRIQLQQVIVNLVRNACDALDGQAEGAISIAARREGAYARVTVRDDGPGIPPERLPTIFDSFVSSKAQGMGIGLSISRTIVEAHDGRIGAESVPGEGATVWIDWPLAD